MQSLFPQNNSNSPSAIVEFRAGKCILSSIQENGKYMVTSDTRKGKISLTKADGLMHFKWINGLTNVVEDDRIVFPGEYCFKKVNTGRESDRVYMLKYLSGDQVLMYWMQDKSTEKDIELLKKVNDFLSNVVTSATVSDAPNVLGPDEWMQMIGLNSSGAARPPMAPSTNAAQPLPFGNLDLASILSSISAANNNSTVLPPPTTSNTHVVDSSSNANPVPEATAVLTTSTESNSNQDNTTSSNNEADDSKQNDDDENPNMEQ